LCKLFFKKARECGFAFRVAKSNPSIAYSVTPKRSEAV
jgi:hypothetical protein